MKKIPQAIKDMLNSPEESMQYLGVHLARQKRITFKKIAEYVFSSKLGDVEISGIDDEDSLFFGIFEFNKTFLNQTFRFEVFNDDPTSMIVISSHAYFHSLNFDLLCTDVEKKVMRDRILENIRKSIIHNFKNYGKIKQLTWTVDLPF